ncbi:MAG: class I SAM-dependent methyltransferase [bacterium]|nr:class I SAM-dependent methyltransferase [bacterium]
MWQIILAIGFVLLASLAYAATQGAPWVPTWNRDLKRIARLANLKTGESFVELGCGNARVCRGIKKHHPDVEVTGVELSMLQYGVGWLQNQLSRSGVKMKLANAFKQDLTDTDVVYLFLMPETYEKIRPKFEAELKTGARVISYVWPIPDWEPVEINESEDSPKLFLYQR